MSEDMTGAQFRELLSRFDKIEERIDVVDHRVETLDHRVETLDHRVETLDRRVETLESSMVTKFDVFQAVFTVQGFTFAIIVGCIVVLNSTGIL